MCARELRAADLSLVSENLEFTKWIRKYEGSLLIHWICQTDNNFVFITSKKENI